MNQEKVNEAYAEYQILMQNLEQLQQHLSLLDKHILNLIKLKTDLFDISNIKNNSESLVSLGSGIFLKAEIKDTQNVVMNVGGNVTVEKTISEAQETVGKDIIETEKVRDNLTEELNHIASRIQELQEFVSVNQPN
jgi:prefoldin alpha subunit